MEKITLSSFVLALSIAAHLFLINAVFVFYCLFVVCYSCHLLCLSVLALYTCIIWMITVIPTFTFIKNTYPIARSHTSQHSKQIKMYYFIHIYLRHYTYRDAATTQTPSPRTRPRPRPRPRATRTQTTSPRTRTRARATTSWTAKGPTSPLLCHQLNTHARDTCGSCVLIVVPTKHVVVYGRPYVFQSINQYL